MGAQKGLLIWVGGGVAILLIYSAYKSSKNGIVTPWHLLSTALGATPNGSKAIGQSKLLAPIGSATDAANRAHAIDPKYNAVAPSHG